MRLAKEEVEMLEDTARRISGRAVRSRQYSDHYELQLQSPTGEHIDQIKLYWWIKLSASNPAAAMLEFMQLEEPGVRLASFEDFHHAIYEFSKEHARG